GFLRSERSLIQTAGRAARNEHGEVYFYADKITDSMQVAIDETNRRRKKQIEYNTKYNITPTTIKKDVRDVIRATVAAETEEAYKEDAAPLTSLSKKEKGKVIERMEKEMREAAKALDFEKAAELRDVVFELKAEG